MKPRWFSVTAGLGLFTHSLLHFTLLSHVQAQGTQSIQDSQLGNPALRMSAALSNPPLASATPATSTQTLSPLFAQQPIATAVNSACTQAQLASDTPLGLGEVIERILCQSPRMRQALASITEQHASVLLAEQARRPRVSANADVNISESPATTLLSATRSRNANAGLAMNWVLFDFGASNANIRSARSSLAAALADQSATQLAQLEEGIRLYVEALNASARLDSLQQTEKAAQQSLEIASARYSSQTGSLAERLQANSALAQVRLELTRGQGQWRAASGNLAVAMGLPVRQKISLAAWDQRQSALGFLTQGTENSSEQLDALWSTVKAEHPRLRAVRSEIEALQARLEQTKAEGRGSVSVNSGVGINQGLGGTSSRELASNINIGVQANIPLFDSASQGARQTQITAQISSRQAQLSIVERELETTLWQAFQQVTSDQESLKASQTLVDVATQGQEVALGRYRAGVGSVVDLLNAQNVQSQAVLQRANAGIALLQSQLRLSLFSHKSKQR
jgi:outer membrane protein